MVMDEEIKRELDRLWDTVRRMDEQGTRGVVAVQIQITELIKDFTEFKMDIHREMQTAGENRKWFIGILVTLLGIAGGIAGVYIQGH